MKRIKSLENIFFYKMLDKKLICPTQFGFDEPTPAADIMEISGLRIRRLLNEGLYLYEEKQKKELDT